MRVCSSAPWKRPPLNCLPLILWERDADQGESDICNTHELEIGRIRGIGDFKPYSVVRSNKLFLLAALNECPKKSTRHRAGRDGVWSQVSDFSPMIFVSSNLWSTSCSASQSTTCWVIPEAWDFRHFSGLRFFLLGCESLPWLLHYCNLKPS